MSFIETYIVVIAHILAWPAVRYWWFYRSVRWKDGDTGKALFNKARSLALIIVIALVGYWLPWPGYLYFYAASLTYLTAAVWYQYRVMRKLFARRDHRDRRDRALEIHTIHPERTPDEAPPAL